MERASGVDVVDRPHTGALEAAEEPTPSLQANAQGNQLKRGLNLRGHSPKSTQRVPTVDPSYKLVPTVDQFQIEITKKVKVPTQIPLLNLVQNKEKVLGDLPLCKRLGFCIEWWKRFAPPKVLDILTKGIAPESPLPGRLSTKNQFHTPKDLELAREILRDYEKSGAVKKVLGGEHTKHLFPFFVLSNEEGDTINYRLLIANSSQTHH